MIDILAHLTILIALAYFGAPLYARLGRERIYDPVAGALLITACVMCGHCVLYATPLGALLWLACGLAMAHGWMHMQRTSTGWRALNAQAVAA